jgi:flagellar assembly protein FliH
MIKSVISSSNLYEHNIEPYRFKVLGSVVDPKKKSETEPKKEKEPKPVKKEPEAMKAAANKEQSEASKQPESLFVEELLKKTDELSSNIVKLQMKIENQEAEFEKRLAQETARAQEMGEKIGQEKAQKAMLESHKQLEMQFGKALHVMEEAYQSFQAFLKKSEAELSEAAIDIAKEVIKKEVSKDAASVSISLAKALMKELADATKFEVRVNPKTYEAVKEAFGEFEHIQVGTNDAIAEGGVIILSDAGNIDGALMARLEKVKQMMKE